jgi:hypothetical protein
MTTLNPVLAPAQWRQRPIRRSGATASSVLSLFKREGIYVIIAGGYARFVVSDNDNTPPARDIDCFFCSQEAFDKACVIMDEIGAVKVYQSANAFSYVMPNTTEWQWTPVIQLIDPSSYRFEKTINPYSIVDAFDLNISKAFLYLVDTPADNSEALQAMVSESFIKDDKSNSVTTSNITSALSTLSRLCKYAGMGYSVKQATILNVLEFWDTIKTEDRKTILEKAKAGLEYGY